jgi:aryl-alcohol dehydrogenase-like predicted oxidoreductase
MELRPMGDTGLLVPVLGLGTNNFGRRTRLEESRAVFHAALDDGLTFIDTADVYSAGQSESILGELLPGHRQQVILATKFGQQHAGSAEPARVRASLEGSLRRLRTEYVDLLYLHFPDPVTPIEDTLRALDDLRREGKLRWIGTSNFAAWQVVEAEFVARMVGTVRFISAQNEYSILNRSVEPELSPACVRYNVGLVAFRPLAHGFLTGKYQRHEQPPAGTRLAERNIRKPDAEFDVLDRVEAFARVRGLELLEIALGRVLAQPGVSSAIIGATTAEQVAANAKALTWHPTAEDLAELDAILPMRLYPGGRAPDI